MKRTLLAVLHLIGATLFVVFMIARTAQAVAGAPAATDPDRQPAHLSRCGAFSVTVTPMAGRCAAPATGETLFQ